MPREESAAADGCVRDSIGSRELSYASINWIRFQGSPCRPTGPMASQPLAGAPLVRLRELAVVRGPAGSRVARKIVRVDPKVNGALGSMVRWPAVLERSHALAEQLEKRRSLRSRKTREHLPLHAPRPDIAVPEHLLALAREADPYDASVPRIRSARHEFLRRHRRDDLVHRLRRHERAPRELCVRERAARGEHRQRSVLRHRESERARHLTEPLPHGAIEPADGVRDAGLHGACHRANIK